MIDRFLNENIFLNNFSKSLISYNGKCYPTNEHFYQACKTLTEEDHELIRLAETPHQAAAIGRKCEIRADWEEVKIKIMKKGLLLKFTQNESLKEKLLATGNQFLVQCNKHNDTFWGVCNGDGRNVLGYLLMDLREKLSCE